MKNSDIFKSLNTSELAELFRVEPDTIRRSYCVNGHYLGLKPVKLPNKRLIWALAEALKVAGGDQ